MVCSEPFAFLPALICIVAHRSTVVALYLLCLLVSAIRCGLSRKVYSTEPINLYKTYVFPSIRAMSRLIRRRVLPLAKVDQQIMLRSSIP